MILKFWNILIYSKWKWFLKKSNILLYDGEGNHYKNLSKTLKFVNFSTLYIRGEELNFYILLKTLFFYGFKNLKRNYRYQFIKSVNPKVIITFADTNIGFFNLKYDFPKVVFIAIQSGIKGKEILDNFKIKKNKKPIVDYYFVYSKFYKEELKKKISAKFIIIGSFTANLVKIKQTNNNKIIFISKHAKTIREPVPKQEYEILKILGKFSKINNIKLDIILKHKENKVPYQNFLINCKIFFSDIKFSKVLNASYKLCRNYNLIINGDSTLGYEMLSLKKKVLFICYGSIESNRWYYKNFYPYFRITRFGYPAFKGRNKGPFWTNSLDKKYINRLLIKSIKYNTLSWCKRYKKLTDMLMPRDENNKKFLQIIKIILKK